MCKLSFCRAKQKRGFIRGDLRGQLAWCFRCKGHFRSIKIHVLNLISSKFTAVNSDLCYLVIFYLLLLREKFRVLTFTNQNLENKLKQCEIVRNEETVDEAIEKGKCVSDFFLANFKCNLLCNVS